MFSNGVRVIENGMKEHKVHDKYVGFRADWVFSHEVPLFIGVLRWWKELWETACLLGAQSTEKKQLNPQQAMLQQAGLSNGVSGFMTDETSTVRVSWTKWRGQRELGPKFEVAEYFTSVLEIFGNLGDFMLKPQMKKVLHAHPGHVGQLALCHVPWLLWCDLTPLHWICTSCSVAEALHGSF